MNRHSVVIAGGGPTGLMLAGELALAGIDVAIVERRVNQQLAGSRAGGLHSRTIEVLDQRGIADRFISQGQKYPFLLFNMMRLDITDCPTRHNYLLGLRQPHIENILASWVEELGVPIYRSREVSGLTQNDTDVTVELSDGSVLGAEYLVGCDGGRSIVRKTAGIDFPGWDATTSWLLAEAHTTEEPEWGFRHDAMGTHAIGKLESEGMAAFVLTEQQPSASPERTLHDVSDTLIDIYGTDYGVHDAVFISSFTDMCRQAATYRDRRVLLAGDAAHVHPPMGGQGLNIGVQDAVNLGWKLAQVVRRTSPESLLDTYHAERHPVAARVLRNTMAQVALRRQDERTKALAEMMAELLSIDEPRKRMVAEMSGLGVKYDMGEGHPLLGRRMPDLDLVTADGAARVYALLHDARALVINFGVRGDIDITPWAERVRLVEARYDGEWDLPAVGKVTAPTAVLVRPDGYVAWVGEGGLLGLAETISTWFESPDTEQHPD